ncbi:MAG: hypothetical protein AAFY91_10900 [Bacteroidota bacterium]
MQKKEHQQSGRSNTKVQETSIPSSRQQTSDNTTADQADWSSLLNDADQEQFQQKMAALDTTQHSAASKTAGRTLTQPEQTVQDQSSQTTEIAQAEWGLAWFGPVGIAIAGSITAGIVISVWWNFGGGKELVGTVTDAAGRGISGTIDAIGELLDNAGKGGSEYLGDIADYLSGSIFTAQAPANPEEPTNPPQEPEIPEDYVSEPTENGNGTIWRKPGTTGSAGTIRVMPDQPSWDEEGWYSEGYWVQRNNGNQPMNPSTGRPARTRAEWHIPLP